MSVVFENDYVKIVTSNNDKEFLVISRKLTNLMFNEKQIKSF